MDTATTLDKGHGRSRASHVEGDDGVERVPGLGLVLHKSVRSRAKW